MKDDQQTDYIAYLVEPKQDYYLIPYKEIKNAYHRNQQQWLNYATVVVIILSTRKCIMTW